MMNLLHNTAHKLTGFRDALKTSPGALPSWAETPVILTEARELTCRETGRQSASINKHAVDLMLSYQSLW